MGIEEITKIESLYFLGLDGQIASYLLSPSGAKQTKTKSII